MGAMAGSGCGRSAFSPYTPNADNRFRSLFVANAVRGGKDGQSVPVGGRDVLSLAPHRARM